MSKGLSKGPFSTGLPRALKEKRGLESLFDDLKRTGALTKEISWKFKEVYGFRFRKGLDACLSRKVKKYVFRPSGRVVWVVTGESRDYIVFPDFYCSCKDFYLNVVVRGKTDACYHLIARKFAEHFNLFELFILRDEEYRGFIEEWVKF